LQWDRSYEDAVNRIINAPRTCHLILAVGDGTVTLSFSLFSFFFTSSPHFSNLLQQHYTKNKLI
jgi:hypothetical protein